MEGPNTITVTECLGPNLKKLFKLQDKKFTVATIAMIAVQVVRMSYKINDEIVKYCGNYP